MLPAALPQVAGLVAVAVVAVSPAAADRILGPWLTEDGRARVEVSRTGDAYSGRIVWLKEPVYLSDDERGMAGRPVVDRENPDPRLRERPLVGLEILWGFVADDDEWTRGRVYDPETGKTYKARLRLDSRGRLELRGYVGIPLFGRTSRWRRPPDAAAPTAASGRP